MALYMSSNIWQITDTVWGLHVRIQRHTLLTHSYFLALDVSPSCTTAMPLHNQPIITEKVKGRNTKHWSHVQDSGIHSLLAQGIVKGLWKLNECLPNTSQYGTWDLYSLHLKYQSEDWWGLLAPTQPLQFLFDCHIGITLQHGSIATVSPHSGPGFQASCKMTYMYFFLWLIIFDCISNHSIRLWSITIESDSEHLNLSLLRNKS